MDSGGSSEWAGLQVVAHGRRCSGRAWASWSLAQIVIGIHEQADLGAEEAQLDHIVRVGGVHVAHLRGTWCWTQGRARRAGSGRAAGGQRYLEVPTEKVWAAVAVIHLQQRAGARVQRAGARGGGREETRVGEPPPRSPPLPLLLPRTE